MKFGEQLEQNLVPEWRAQYLNYKTGKRYLKAVSRAVAKADAASTQHKPFAIQSPFTPTHKRYQRMPTVRFEDDVDHHESDTRDIEMSSVTQPQTITGDIVDSPTSNTRGDSEDQVSRPPDHSSSYTSGSQDSTRSRPVVARLAIPTGIDQQPHGVRILSPDTPGALQRISTFVRKPTVALEQKMDPKDIVFLREQEFFDFMDRELNKVETFYEEKEKQAGNRLNILRQQLHIMRTRRNKQLNSKHRLSLASKLSRSEKETAAHQTPFTPIKPAVGNTAERDYVKKRTHEDDVSYRAAKQKLRLALQEFYRSLELLKAYSLLNLTAFRKLMKKCDKMERPNARSGKQWMTEHASSADFVKSHQLEEYVEQVEDLYTRYFENGNRKLARTKLRRLASAEGNKAISAAFNGVLVGVGLTFAVEAVVLGVKKLFEEEDEEIRLQTSFLLQIYAGYFLMLYLFTWFCFSCRIWNAFKVNYSFIFEFDPKHDLDWKQLSEFPSVLTLLMGLCMWLNFSDIFEDVMYLWYPVVLIGLTLILIFLPLPLFRWRSRRWFVIAHGRLLFAGIFAVEFRDFFLGDMYCSLAYAVANAEVFFCLYVRSWEGPIDCDSSRSILLGFLAALPAIWRSFQCIRRFWDSNQAFPHLANLLKYLFTISTAVTLSLYRRGGSQLLLMLFIAFSSISAFYALVWDIFMDFSLLQPGSKNTGLRDILAFDAHKWMYYAVMPLNAVLRFPWIFMAIFSRNLQHGSIVAFCVAFAEVTRRGLWAMFRVENEHSTNIGQAKASRDVPLPYEVKERTDESTVALSASLLQNDHLAAASKRSSTGDSISAAEAGQSGRTKSPVFGLFRSMSLRFASAHAQDFTRRKPTLEMEQHTPTREQDQTLQSDGEVSEHEDRIVEGRYEGTEDPERRQVMSGANVHKLPPAA